MVSMKFSLSIYPLLALLTFLLFYRAVPEHFSTPLYIAQEQGFFRDNNVNVELVCCPGK
jgi:ABC-type nitrate/sulfonate/bicarbonate transport system substrate-binding protein